jgi:hypothetical protein
MNIQIFRPKQFVDMARDYKLFADDVEVATIKRGIAQTFEIPDSTKNIQAKIDWCSSQPFPVASISDKGIIIKNTFGSNKLFLLTIYYITVGKNRYLSITNSI